MPKSEYTKDQLIAELLEALKEAKRVLLPSMFGTPAEEVNRLGKLYSEAIAKAEAK